MTKAEFVRLLALAFEPTDLSVPSTDIAIAHAAYESGWGYSRASREGLNHWNLTAGSSWLGPVVVGGDRDEHGEHILQRFRKYDSHYDAAVDYIAFLHYPRYTKAWNALLDVNAAEFTRWLHDDDPTTPRVEGGFYTADPTLYRVGVAACLSMVRVLRSPQEVA